MSIAGIVLAAGASRRMGSAKSLLIHQGRTFLARSVEALKAGGCDPVVVVVGTGEEHDQAFRIASEHGATVIVNHDAGSEQLDSLRLALAALPASVRAAAVMPVDIPEVSGSLVRSLVHTFESTGAPVTLPVRGERHGHPVIFTRSIFPELINGEFAEGARSVVHAHLHEAAQVPVAHLPEDVDTPGDLERLDGRR